jgi:hypothetical protein
MTHPIVWLLLGACTDKQEDSAPVEVYDPHTADSDGDGLVDYDEEKLYGTDMNNPDSDGDGYTDGEEVIDLLTSPTNPYSRPYKGGFNVGDCPTTPDPTVAHPTGARIIETSGGGATKVALYEPGDTVANFNLLDQYGERVDLYSFCGKYVDILFFQYNQLVTPQYGALSCWINDFSNVHRYYRDYGYELLVVLTQGTGTDLPSSADLEAVSVTLGWNDRPVLALEDDSFGSFHSWMEKDFHEPTLVHIGPDLKIISVDEDNCAGADRDPCKYMGDWIPEGLCWDNPNPDCEPVDYSGPYLFCACPADACEAYCGEGKCPVTW